MHISHFRALSQDENGKLVYDEEVFQENVKQYVRSLAEKYNTVGTKRTFISTASGAEIVVEGGAYGWEIDQQKEMEQLLEEIKGGAVVSREPLYVSTAVTREGNEIGNTYVEVDLENQHMWFYKNGKLIVESDIISGLMTKKDCVTPEGVYSLNYKQKGKTLRGRQQSNGTYEYESWVDYWMPFNGGIGLHDVSWKPAFGGIIYKTDGSHGCINLPPSIASIVYENIEAGVPIVCFY